MPNVDYFYILQTLGEYITVLAKDAPVLIGFAMPPVIDFLNKDVPNKKARFIITLFVCTFAGALLKWDSVTLGDPGAVLGTAGLIFLQSQAVYKLYFKGSAVREALIERKLAPIPDNVEGLQ